MVLVIQDSKKSAQLNDIYLTNNMLNMTILFADELIC